MRAHSPRRRLAAALAPLLLGACLSLPKPEPVELFTLEPTFEAGATPATGPVLLVPAPRPGPGFDGPGMAYLQRPNQLQYFSKSQWVEPPARLLGPLAVRALERTGKFRAVTETALGARPDLRLELELVRLQQEFISRPSRVRCTLRLQLTDVAGHRILGTRELEALEPAPSEDAAGGAVAAGTAVRRALSEAATWSAEVTQRWRDAPPGP
jgi:cholesterol transport system auxiliary component